MGDELHYKELNDQNVMYSGLFLRYDVTAVSGPKKRRISIPKILQLVINENPPKFSTKGDCHVYSWL